MKINDVRLLIKEKMKRDKVQKTTNFQQQHPQTKPQNTNIKVKGKDPKDTI